MRNCNRIVVTFLLSFGLFAALLWILGSPGKPVIAASRIDKHSEEFNFFANELHVCLSECAYSSIQSAVDAANDGDVIKVAAGVYTDVQERESPPGYYGSSVVMQIVYISKTVTIRGGYTTTDWVTSHPLTSPTIVDAQGKGRGLFIYGNISPTIEGLYIINGEAVGLGGRVNDYLNYENTGAGIYVSNATVNLLNNIIRDNKVSFSYTSYGGGGAGIYLADSNSRLVNNVVISNMVANRYGGGLWAYKGNITLENNVINYNQAAQAVGVYLEEITAVLVNNTLSNNQTWMMTGGSGGGLSATGSTVTLRGNVISKNYAYGFGGGIGLMETNVFAVNNVIIDNHAVYNSSGIYAQKSVLQMYHTTFARNTGGDKSGVYIDQGNVGLTNTVLSEQGVGIVVNNGGVAELNGVLWYSNTTNVGGGSISVTHAYTGTPAFANDGYHLTSDSVAIDKGVNAGVSDDIDGDLRKDGFPDLGADECYYAALNVTKQVYPDSVQPGEQLTYTIRITNTGNIDLYATITDTLPVYVALGNNSGGTAWLPGGTLVLRDGRMAVTWTTTITAPTGVWVGTIVVTVAEDYKGPLTNLVEVTTREGVVGSARVTVNFYKIYLPLVLRSSL